MTIDFTLGLLTTALGIFAAIMLGGFATLFTRMDRLETKMDAIPGEFAALRRDLAEEFRAQRAEVSAQTTALANVIIAARG